MRNNDETSTDPQIARMNRGYCNPVPAVKIQLWQIWMSVIKQYNKP
jgi:hypothetical protein